MLQTMYRGPS